VLVAGIVTDASAATSITAITLARFRRFDGIWRSYRRAGDRYYRWPATSAYVSRARWPRQGTASKRPRSVRLRRLKVKQRAHRGTGTVGAAHTLPQAPFTPRL